MRSIRVCDRYALYLCVHQGYVDPSIADQHTIHVSHVVHLFYQHVGEPVVGDQPLLAGPTQEVLRPHEGEPGDLVPVVHQVVHLF